jgi:hypothetical protein
VEATSISTVKDITGVETHQSSSHPSLVAAVVEVASADSVGEASAALVVAVEAVLAVEALVGAGKPYPRQSS